MGQTSWKTSITLSSTLLQCWDVTPIPTNPHHPPPSTFHQNPTAHPRPVWNEKYVLLCIQHPICVCMYVCLSWFDIEFMCYFCKILALKQKTPLGKTKAPFSGSGSPPKKPRYSSQYPQGCCLYGGNRSSSWQDQFSNAWGQHSSSPQSQWLLPRMWTSEATYGLQTMTWLGSAMVTRQDRQFTVTQTSKMSLVRCSLPTHNDRATWLVP